jgi:hypothetical protein
MKQKVSVKTNAGAQTRTTVINSLLICGIAVAVVQIAGDVVAAAGYAGYSYVNQSVSELSAIGAPTRSFLVVVGILYDALVVAFAVGVWRAAGRTRAMRITAVLLAVFALNGLVWSFFPMQQRGSGMAATDIAHIVGAILQVLTMMLFIAFGSGADGRWFRIFSILMIAAILIAGGAVATQASRIAQGLPTPWHGLIERVSFYGPSLWILTLAAVLLRDWRA